MRKVSSSGAGGIAVLPLLLVLHHLAQLFERIGSVAFLEVGAHPLLAPVLDCPVDSVLLDGLAAVVDDTALAAAGRSCSCWRFAALDVDGLAVLVINHLGLIAAAPSEWIPPHLLFCLL